MIRELDYERSPAPLVPIEARRIELPASLSGLILIVGGLLVLGFALSHISTATQAEAVAWAFVVAAVFAALRKWA